MASLLREIVEADDVEAEDDRRSSSLPHSEELSASDTSGDGYNIFFFFGIRLRSLGAVRTQDKLQIKGHE